MIICGLKAPHEQFINRGLTVVPRPMAMPSDDTKTGYALQLIDNSRPLYHRPEFINQQTYFLGRPMAAQQLLGGQKDPSSEGAGPVPSLEGPFNIS